jgi:predicted dehydrogenase
MLVRVGVIGVGALGRHHVRLLATESPWAQLAGAHDARPERAGFATQYGARAFPSAAALIAACDAVVVASATATHRAVAGQVLEAGRHCLVEKPLAASAAECEELVALAAATGRVLHVGHVERLNPAVRAARALIRRPRFIESHRLASFAPRGVDVDVLLDLMIHDLDLVLDWTGQEPEAVAAVGVAVLTEREDIANARLEFPDGCVANLTASRVSQERMRKLRLFQADSYLSLDCAEGTAEIVEADRAALAAATRDALAAVLSGGGAPLAAGAAQPDWSTLVTRRPLPVPSGNPLALELEAFGRAAGGLEPLPGIAPADGAAGTRAVRVAERLAEALRERTRRWGL